MSTLDGHELDRAQSCIDALPAGIYEAKEIYGERWKDIVAPTTFGSLFLETVRAGKLRDIRHNSVKSNNHNDYKVKMS